MFFKLRDRIKPSYQANVNSQHLSLLRIAYPAVGDDIGRFSLGTIYA